MSTTAGRRLEDFYEAVESGYTLTHGADYETLVTPNGNANEPVHRWFHVKEAYSHRFLPRLVKDIGLDTAGPLTIVDPFAGSATTLVSALDMARSGEIAPPSLYGSEVNPFLHLLSRTKVRASCTGAVPEFLDNARAIAALSLKPVQPAIKLPELTTLHDARYFPDGAALDLMRLRSAVDTLYPDDCLARDLSLVCLAAAAEPASKLRKDGRALRYQPDKQVAHPVDAFLDRARMVDEDLRMPAPADCIEVTLGDSRERFPSAEGADLCVFSPPYPNNIDYSEVYKVEAWLLGFITSQAEFAEQRRRTLRSHPSLKFDSDYGFRNGDHADDVTDILEPIIAAIPSESRYAAQRLRMVLGYFDDMLKILRGAFDTLRPGGGLVYVVGNSLHGGTGGDDLMIASDIILAELARVCGFEVDEVCIARVPTRRASESKFLRESVVFAHRPEGAAR